MQASEHSRTAEATAAIRASHLLYDQPTLFEDPYALSLTSPLWRTVCRYPLLHQLVVRGVLRGLRPVHGWILVRDFLTEQALKAFVAGGGAQFVLLGAGFDSTALRRPPWLEEVHIIEVDHPATQAVKLERIERFQAALPRESFEAVAVDFERERLADALARSAFDPHRPTLFAWPGVVYYLTTPAIAETLSDIGRLAAPGSELLFDFLLPEHALGQDEARVMSLARLITARMGERYVSFHTPEDIAALLAPTGFDELDVRLDSDLQAAYFDGRGDDLSAMRGFGIAHARRR